MHDIIVFLAQSQRSILLKIAVGLRLRNLMQVSELRLQHKEVSASTENAVKEITTFLGMLSDYYKKDKEEGLKFE